jgi:hypothetical protein
MLFADSKESVFSLDKFKEDKRTSVLMDPGITP